MVAVVSRAAWGAAFEIPAGRHVNPSARREVVIHWPGSAVGADPAAVVRAIERSHRQGNGWQAAPGYNFLIGGGRIFEGCGRDVRGIHVGVGNINTTAWGICVLQGVGQPVAQADLNACRALIDWLCHVAGRDLARSSHGHHMATQCAGPALNGWVNAGMPATAPPPPPPPPTGGPPAWPGRILRQPPIMRGDDVRTWQAAARGLTVDGAYGPLSEARCRQIQAAADLPVDGRVGPNTWPATWLVAGATPPTPPRAPAPPWPGRILINQRPMMSGADVRTWQARAGRITVDGWYGPQSEARCREIQRQVGLPVDGRVGPNTWPATWTT